MSGTIYWVDGPWRGKLGLAARPRGGDWLSDDVAAWKRATIETVVSLLTSDEEKELQLANETAELRNHGIDFLSLPIRDRGVPESESEVDAIVQQLDHVLAAGRNVLVHCRQGIGRSGLLAACLLISRGQDAASALAKISTARGLDVPETREQRRWVEQYAPKVRAH